MSDFSNDSRLICGTCGECGRVEQDDDKFRVACYRDGQLCCMSYAYDTQDEAANGFVRLTDPRNAPPLDDTEDC